MVSLMVYVIILLQSSMILLLITGPFVNCYNRVLTIWKWVAVYKSLEMAFWKFCQ